MEKRLIGVIIAIVVVVGLGAFYFFGGISTVRGDPDGDHLKTSKEKELGTDPHDPDTDGNGIKDNTELEIGTGPVDFDTDTDGLGDGKEVNELETDPKDEDTDDDGLNDGPEANTYDTDPKNPDTDGDGLDDGREVNLGTKPDNPDTDGDGVNDGRELELGLEPLNSDTDGDGLKDGHELEIGTEPRDTDTDDDGFNDSEDVRPTFNAGVQVSIDYYKELDNPDGGIRGQGDYYFNIIIADREKTSSARTGREFYDPYSVIIDVPDDTSPLIAIGVWDYDTLKEDDQIDVNSSIKYEVCYSNFNLTNDKAEKIADGSKDGDSISDGYMEFTIKTVRLQ